jgi:hypothetical protein
VNPHTNPFGHINDPDRIQDMIDDAEDDLRELNARLKEIREFEKTTRRTERLSKLPTGSVVRYVIYGKTYVATKTGPDEWRFRPPVAMHYAEQDVTHTNAYLANLVGSATSFEIAEVFLGIDD